MSILKSVEIVDLGIEKEKKRRDFYALAAEKFKGEELKKLFARLRDWEETHIKKFREIREGINDYETRESYPGEMEAYMKALVDDLLYNKVSPAEFEKNIKNPADAIQYGISFEKDAILFFRELLPYMNSSHRGIVEQLIEEEKQHIVYLSQLKGRIVNSEQ